MSFESLCDSIVRYTETHTGNADGHYTTAIDGVSIIRGDEPTLPVLKLNPARALCFVVQGSKEVTLGGQSEEYGAGQYALVSVDLPMTTRITRASPVEPYLALILTIDVPILREVVERLEDAPPPSSDAPHGGYVVIDIEPRAADCALRIVRMLETPRAIPVLYPSVVRELYYWIASGTHGGALRRLAVRNGHTERIAKAIAVIKRDLSHPIRVEQLAAVAGMSESSFHAHFKAMTSMSPLQYQKQLRLLTARRLLMTSAANASEAAYQVGYASPSQFSREYSRMFGCPPSRDSAASERLQSARARIAAPHSPAVQGGARRAP